MWEKVNDEKGKGRPYYRGTYGALRSSELYSSTFELGVNKYIFNTGRIPPYPVILGTGLIVIVSIWIDRGFGITALLNITSKYRAYLNVKYTFYV
jgi:hypothetical protein